MDLVADVNKVPSTFPDFMDIFKNYLVYARHHFRDIFLEYAKVNIPEQTSTSGISESGPFMDKQVGA